MKGERDHAGDVWEDVRKLFDTPVNEEMLEKDRDQRLDGAEPETELHTQESLDKEFDWHQNSLGKLSEYSFINPNPNAGLNLCFVKPLAGMQAETDDPEGLQVGKDTQGILSIPCDSHEYRRITYEPKN